MTWVGGNRYLSQSEMETNALYIKSYLLNEGWTLNAIAGVLGNMQTESTINPSIWQSLAEGNTRLGYGLVQWTPATKYIDWCNENNIDYTHMDSNLKRILLEVESGIQYYPTSKYPLTFKEFTKSNASPRYLASAFLHNYERPANSNQDDVRGRQADTWFEFISGENAPASIEEIIDFYCKWLVEIAEDDTHGYSQAERSLYNWINPTSFDCSSFLLTGLQYAFETFNVTPTPKSVGCTYTGNMLNLLNCGFEIVERNPTTTSSAKKGDIDLKASVHTACYLGNNMLVQASSDYGTNNTIDDDGREIAVRSWYNYPWTTRLRFTGKGVNIGGSTTPVDPSNPIRKNRRLSKILLYEG